jgi:signal transduction histidine kinase
VTGASRSTTLGLPVAIGLAGLCLAGAISLVGGVGTSDALQLLAYSVGGAAGCGLSAALILHRFARLSITTQTVVATMTPVLAAAVGVTWAASEMFLMNHDLVTLGIVLVTAGTVSSILAVTLGRRVARASGEIIDMARRLDDDRPLRRPGTTDGPGELTVLARELESTSARLVEARRRADVLERSRQELLSWASHDLRTPLAGIRAMIEAIEDGVVNDDATVSRYHAAILLETHRLGGLVDDLFELSQIQAGNLQLTTQIVPLGELVSEAVAACQAAAAPVQLRTSCTPAALLIEVAPAEVLRVLRNLIDNAVRHTPPGEHVVIDAGQEADIVWIAVTDACGGIPESDLPRLFDTGFRGDAARTPGDGRGGIGLAIARGLVAAHNGELDVVNIDGGCRFTVRLPGIMARRVDEPPRQVVLIPGVRCPDANLDSQANALSTPAEL